MNKPILLVTGTNGFVGRHLLAYLNDVGFSFHKLSRNSKSNQVDAVTLQNLDKINIDVVIHLAAKAHVLKQDGINDAYEFNKANVEFTMSVIEQARLAGAKRFIFLSSIGVHGITNRRPFNIEDILSPVELYSVSKMEAENRLKQFAKAVGMELVIIRPPLVYGKNAPGNFGRLLSLVMRNLPSPLGGIHNKRSLVSLDNLIDLIVTCIDHPKAANQTFLVSDDHDVSTTELLTMMTHACGKKPRLIPVPVSWLKLVGKFTGKQAVIDRLCGNLQVDITHTKETLGWKPPISVEEGIRRCFTDSI